jgi:hypothetical protein
MRQCFEIYVKQLMEIKFEQLRASVPKQKFAEICVGAGNEIIGLKA